MSRYETPSGSYYAYNETFVDDEGLQLYQNELQSSQYLKNQEDDDDDETIDEEYCQDQDNNQQRYYITNERYDDRLDYLNLSTREPPIGDAPIYRHVEQPVNNNTTKICREQQKQHRYETIRSRQRSSSVPSRRRNTSTANVLAPMIAQADRHQGLRRSHSTILPPTRNRQQEQVCTNIY